MPAPTPISVQSKSSSSFYVPTIDIAPYLQNPSSAASSQIITEIRAACESTGFFQIINHGIPTTLQDSLFHAAEQFFALPFEAKKALDAKTMLGHRGYDVLATQSYEEGVMPDLKEVSTNREEADPDPFVAAAAAAAY